MRILFLGNSHTEYNRLPVMVESLLKSDGAGRPVYVEQIVGRVLNDHFKSQPTRKRVADPLWDVVVLQGAMMSSSHKFIYPQDGAIGLAKLARASGSRVIFFAEWPRKGWKETDFILNIYRGIREKAGGEIAAACRAWDVALAKKPDLVLWEHDGNHAAPLGSYLAAATIYFKITGVKSTPTWRSKDVATTPGVAKLLVESARTAVLSTKG